MDKPQTIDCDKTPVARPTPPQTIRRQSDETPTDDREAESGGSPVDDREAGDSYDWEAGDDLSVEDWEPEPLTEEELAFWRSPPQLPIFDPTEERIPPRIVQCGSPFSSEENWDAEAEAEAEGISKNSEDIEFRELLDALDQESQELQR